jgi:lauroyl/myristoyl acyltransferase
MQELLGSDRATDSIEADVRRLMALVIWNSLAFKILPTLSLEQLRNLAAVEGTSLLDDRLASGRPVLVWGYHLGIETATIVVLLSKMGYPLHAVGHLRHAPAKGSILRLSYYAQLQSLADHFSLIDPGEGVQRKILDVLRAKECLFVTPDYMIPPDEMPPVASSVVPVEMLGRQVHLHTGSLRLAKRLDAQVVNVYSTQADGSRRRLVIEPFELPSSGLKPTDLQQDLQMCIGWLEEQVLAHPYWWLDFKRSDLLLRLKKPQA